jgi:hypothetical protein
VQVTEPTFHTAVTNFQVGGRDGTALAYRAMRIQARGAGFAACHPATHEVTMVLFGRFYFVRSWSVRLRQ